LYNIIVIDNAITNESSNLVVLTIKDGDFSGSFQSKYSSLVVHSKTSFHTESTSSHKFTVVLYRSFAGAIKSFNKSFAAKVVHKPKNQTNSNVNNHNFNLFFNVLINDIYTIFD